MSIHVASHSGHVRVAQSWQANVRYAYVHLFLPPQSQTERRTIMFAQILKPNIPYGAPRLYCQDAVFIKKLPRLSRFLTS